MVFHFAGSHKKEGFPWEAFCSNGATGRDGATAAVKAAVNVSRYFEPPVFG